MPPHDGMIQSVSRWQIVRESCCREFAVATRWDRGSEAFPRRTACVTAAIEIPRLHVLASNPCERRPL